MGFCHILYTHLACTFIVLCSKVVRVCCLRSRGNQAGRRPTNQLSCINTLSDPHRSLRAALLGVKKSGALIPNRARPEMLRSD